MNHTPNSLIENLRRVWLILKKELQTFFITPTLYVCLALFTLLSGYLHFWVGDYLEGETASIGQTFFRWHPWLYCFFAPAIFMRLWSEEYRQDTLSFLITMGFRPWHLVLGKFLAAWLVLGLALALTFPVVITATVLGEPDTGAILAGYFGSFLAMGFFLAIANLCATVTENQFITYILGATVSALILVFMSTPSLSTLASTFPESADAIVRFRKLGILSQFSDFQYGRIAVTSLISIFSTIALCLWVTNDTLSRKYC